MAETYSIGTTGALAENQQEPQTAIDVADSVARAPAMRLAMTTRQPFLCQMPDGSQQWCVFDEYRTRAGGAHVLLRYP